MPGTKDGDGPLFELRGVSKSFGTTTPAAVAEDVG
jgi:hypothetical protein